MRKLPQKRQTFFAKPEESLYNKHRPTMVREIGKSVDASPAIAVEKNMQARLLRGFELQPKDDFLESRTALLVNNDIHIGLAAPRKSMTDYFY